MQTNEVYRAPMRARDREAPQFAGARHGVENGIVGTGDALGNRPVDLDEAVAAAGIEHGEKAGRMLDRFAEISRGTFVWTQTDDQVFRLGRITGEWEYDASEAAFEVGIHHVRPTDWLEEEFDLSRTPPAVIDTFARGGKNFQRINAGGIESDTLEIYRRIRGD